ncbi:hypothetical protein RUND412_006511 [Rhizina undulata]
MSSTIVVKSHLTSTASSGLPARSVVKGKAGSSASVAAAAAAAAATANATHYGCEHIKEILRDSSESAKAQAAHYSLAVRVVLDPNRLTAQSCVKCRVLITRTFLCMICTTVNCPKDAELHFKERGHGFGIDSRSGHVYCFHCQDFIYDPTLEEIRREKEAALEGGPRKRRRIEEVKPSPEDLKYIETNTTLAPCKAAGGLRGFLNMGSTCFMSVVLQCLIHNPLIRNFYLSDGHRTKDCTQNNCMSCAMDEVFSEFFTSDKVDGYGPINLLTTSWKCEQTLAGYQQQDAHEYLQFLLNQLHTTNGGSCDIKAGPCKCIIHRSFYGSLQSDVTCEDCQNVTTAVDPVMDLSLDIRVKDKKIKLDNGGGAVQTLQECLERFTKSEKLGVNDYNCSNCSGGGALGATKQLTVKRLPPVLCIQLKRFEHSATGKDPTKVDTKIRFPIKLDMTPFTTRSKRKSKAGRQLGEKRARRSYIYDLLSVVVHKGQINSGHYVNYCTENGQEVLSAEAYLLFYIVRNLA